jgi:hypothetical protein
MPRSVRDRATLSLPANHHGTEGALRRISRRLPMRIRAIRATANRALTTRGMQVVQVETARTAAAGTPTSSSTRRPAYQAYLVLYVGFAALPIVVGLDKFFHLLVNWDQYLAPLAARLLPVSGHTFMQAVGLVEIAAGLLVAIRPRLGAYAVALWLWGIIANLLLIPGYVDIALRDFGLSLEALALARLSQEFDSPLADRSSRAG